MWWLSNIFIFLKSLTGWKKSNGSVQGKYLLFHPVPSICNFLSISTNNFFSNLIKKFFLRNGRWFQPRPRQKPCSLTISKLCGLSALLKSTNNNNFVLPRVANPFLVVTPPKWKVRSYKLSNSWEAVLERLMHAIFWVHLPIHSGKRWSAHI